MLLEVGLAGVDDGSFDADIAVARRLFGLRAERITARLAKCLALLGVSSGQDPDPDLRVVVVPDGDGQRGLAAALDGDLEKPARIWLLKQCQHDRLWKKSTPGMTATI